MDEWLKFLLQCIFTLTAAYLSSYWAVERAFREKWWERKERAYAEIIDSLYELLRYSELCADQHLTSGKANPNDDLAQKYREARWRIKKATAIGAFVISKEAASVLQELDSKSKIAFGEFPNFETYSENCKHYEKALAKIKDYALKDLNPRLLSRLLASSKR